MQRSPILLALLALAFASCGDDFTSVASGELTVDPTEIRFRAVAVGELPDRQSIFISNTASEGDLTLKAVRLETNSPYVTLEWNNVPQDEFTELNLEANAFEQFDLQYAPQSADPQCGVPPEGESAEYCGQLVIESTSLNAPIVVVPVYVPSETGTIEVAPRVLEFAEAVPGDPAESQSFTVTNTGDNALTILGLENTLSPTDEFVLDGEPAPYILTPGQARQYTITFTAKSVDAVRSGTINITSDDPTRPLSTVSVQVGTPNAAQVAVTTEETATAPFALSFVEVNPGDPAVTKTVTITNVGGSTAAALTVGVAIDPSNTEDYTVTDANGNPRAGVPCNVTSKPSSCVQDVIIARGDSAVLDVTYEPQTLSSNATLILTTNDPDSADQEIRVALNGSSGVGFLTCSAGCTTPNDTSLVFLDPVIDTPMTQTVTLENSGTLAVQISEVQKVDFSPASGADLFTLSIAPSGGAEITVNPGDTLDVDITYTRATDDVIEQAFLGNILFVNNGQGGDAQPSITVEVEYSP